MLQDAEVGVVVVEDQEQADKMLEVQEQLPHLRHVIYDDPRGMRNYTEDLLMDYVDLLEQGKAHRQKNPDLYMQSVESLRSDEPAAMFYTSGTTGNPKGVVLTHHALIDRAEVIQRLEGLSDKEDVLAYLPPAWIGQNMFSYTQFLVTGFTVNHPESPDTVSIDMHDVGPTYYFSPPRVLEELLTTVSIRMEDAGRFKKWLYKYFMDVAAKAGQRILDKQSVNLKDRFLYSLGSFFICSRLCAMRLV